jgi:hypothetical protein
VAALQRIKMDDGSFAIILPVNTCDEVYVDIASGKTLTSLLNEVLTEINNTKKYSDFKLSYIQSIPSDVNTKLAITSQTPFNGDDFTLLEGNDIRILDDGIYQVNATVSFTYRGGGARSLEFLINGVLNARRAVGDTQYDETTVSINDNFTISANSLLSFYVKQTSGKALDINNSFVSTKVQIRRVG